MPKPKRHPWVRFFSLFALLYLVLVLPWPGWREAHARGFCALARLVLPAESGQRILRVDTVPPASRNHTLDTRLTIANRAQLDPRGTGPAVLMDLDSRGIAYLPAALISALVLATPLPWRQRLLRLFLGLAAVCALVIFTLFVGVWNTCLEAKQLDLLHLSPLWQNIVRGLDETLIVQLGASFVLPFLFWAILCLTPKSLARLRAQTEPGSI